jgi:hypothetical protein
MNNQMTFFAVAGKWGALAADAESAIRPCRANVPQPKPERLSISLLLIKASILASLPEVNELVAVE